MPLTADVEGVVLDATACSDEEWASVYRVRPRPRLVCRDCGRSMQAKLSSRKLRFFAHDRTSPGCPSTGESPAHRRLKARLAELIRDAGAEATLEAFPSHDDHGGWRADVLSLTPHGKRTAWEVQLAAMTLDEGQRRTATYATDNIQTIWVSFRHSNWMTRIPSVRVIDPEADVLMVDRGLAKYGEIGFLSLRSPETPVPLQKIVVGVLHGTVVPLPEPCHLHEARGDRDLWLVDATPLVSLAALEAAAATERDLRNRELNHQANFERLKARQLRVATTVLDRLADQGRLVWLGSSSIPWRGEPLAAEEAIGPDNAAGLPVRTGTQAPASALEAVVCPVASRCTRSLGERWRRGGVAVYAETNHEASSIAQGLQWPTRWITVVPPSDALGEGASG